MPFESTFDYLVSPKILNLNQCLLRSVVSDRIARSVLVVIPEEEKSTLSVQEIRRVCTEESSKAA